MKRDFSSEIKHLKSRKEFETFWKVWERQNSIETALMQLSKIDESSRKEFLKFIPVTLVATLESILRSSIKKLVDENESCFENGKGLLPEGRLKIEFDYFKGLHKREFTFGEFISHQISCSRIEHFDTALSIVLFGKKTGFLDVIQKFTPVSIYPDIILKSEEYKRDCNEVINSLSTIFDLRHIICHEMSFEFNHTESEITRLYTHTFLFLHQAHEFLSNFLYPNSPETDEQMFEVASQDYEESNKKLVGIIEDIKQKRESFYGTEVNLELFDKAQKHWEEFRKTYVEALLYDMRDGRDYRIFYLEELSDICQNSQCLG